MFSTGVLCSQTETDSQTDRGTGNLDGYIRARERETGGGGRERETETERERRGERKGERGGGRERGGALYTYRHE